MSLFLTILLVLVSIIMALSPQPALAQTWTLIQLTTNGAEDRSPSISGDGTKIAFSSNIDGDLEIFIVNYDGTGLTQLTNNGVLDADSSISGDGTKIAYESNAGGGEKIFIINSDGSGLTQLTITNNGVEDRSPSISNDGKKIAFWSNVDGDWEIFLLELESPGGCFIATAAYGTPMAEEIQVLREFRDRYLITNPVGKALVELYYKVSPPMAEFITEHPALKPVVRAGLVPAIAMSTVAVNTTLAQKIAILSSMVLLSALLVVWLRKRAGKAGGNAN